MKKFISEKIKIYAKESIVIVITNPLDVMTQLAQKITAFDPRRVIGMAGLLDSARLAAFISIELGCRPSDVKTMVLGSHGDSMVAVISQTKVNRKPLTELIDPARINELVERARNGGAEIVKFLKNGSAYYAPAACTAFMVGRIIRDKKTTIPCSVYLTGQYGLNDVYIGVPCRLGRKGVEKIVKIKLTKDELCALHQSAEIVKNNFASINRGPESKTLGS